MPAIAYGAVVDAEIFFPAELEEIVSFGLCCPFIEADLPALPYLPSVIICYNESFFHNPRLAIKSSIASLTSSLTET